MRQGHSLNPNGLAPAQTSYNHLPAPGAPLGCLQEPSAEEAWPQAPPEQHCGGAPRPARPCPWKPQLPTPCRGYSGGPGPLSARTTSAQGVVLLVCEAHGQGGAFGDLIGREAAVRRRRSGRVARQGGRGWGPPCSGPAC